MAQPTGAMSIASAWATKGLSAGAYVTQNGLFAFSAGASAVPASPTSGVVFNVSQTTVGSNGDRLITGINVPGSHHSFAVNAVNAALADNMTWVMDIDPSMGVTGQLSGSIISLGNNSEGGLQVVVENTSATSSTITFQVIGVAYTGTRGCSYVLTGNTRRIAFKYSHTALTRMFVDGVEVTPTATSSSITATTPKPAQPMLIGQAIQYGILPNFSHVLGFNTLLSDADIATLSTDPWVVFDAPVANDPPTFPGPNIADMTGTSGQNLTPVDVSSKFSDTDTLTFSKGGTWPTGVTLSTAGVIGGMPTVDGTFSGLTVVATDLMTQSVSSNTFSITLAAPSGGTLYSNDFEGVADFAIPANWQAPGGGTSPWVVRNVNWLATNGNMVFTSPGSSQGASAEFVGIANRTTVEYHFRQRVALDGTTQYFVGFEHTDDMIGYSSNFKYSIRFSGNTTDVTANLTTYIGGTWNNNIATNSRAMAVAATEILDVVFRVENKVVSVWIWNSNHETKPASPLLTWTDSTQRAAGRLGIVWPGAPVLVGFDELTITDGSGGGGGGGGTIHTVGITESGTLVSVSSASVTSSGSGTITIPAIRDWSTGNLLTGASGVIVIINDVTTGAVVVKKTGLTTHATTGVCVVTDPLIVAATQYRVTTIFADGSEGTWRYTAA